MAITAATLGDHAFGIVDMGDIPCGADAAIAVRASLEPALTARQQYFDACQGDRSSTTWIRSGTCTWEDPYRQVPPSGLPAN